MTIVDVTGPPSSQLYLIYAFTWSSSFSPSQMPNNRCYLWKFGCWCFAISINFSRENVCLLKINFPKDWLLSYTPNHWSNEDKTKEYIKLIIVPYIQRKQKELKLCDTFPALVLFNVFKAKLRNLFTNCWSLITFTLFLFQLTVQTGFSQWI